MATQLILQGIKPTVFLARADKGLRQLVRVTVKSDEALSATLAIKAPDSVVEHPLPHLPAGESAHEVFLGEITRPAAVEFALKVNGSVVDRKEVPWQPPRHWIVHVVQRSHHDVGYTDLPSALLRQHDEFLDAVIDIAASTRDFPEEAQFRIVVEQAWSIDHYLRHAPPERARKMIELMRSGHVELTALFGNMVTEICGHESLVRNLYHAWRISRTHGIPILTAEHNDIPGMSWGLCQALTEAGVKLLCPGLPRYYGWGKHNLLSFWDDRRLFPKGQPGGFWWEAPSGKRILLWDNLGHTVAQRPALPDLADRLQQLAEQGHPYRTVRWPAIGGGRDNSPYIDGYAHTAKAWNTKWAYPRLIVSTNAMFLADISREIPSDLPVFRGELAGQDYPTGSTSTAAATAANRNNHAKLLTAERLATLSASLAEYPYPAQQVFDAYEEVQWYDEHTWGYHFPCGPTMQVSEREKTAHAYRAASLAQDIIDKAMSRIADRVKTASKDPHLVVFNPLPYPRTGPVSAALREMDNGGSLMVLTRDPANPADTHLRAVLLGERWHAKLPLEMVDGKFDLVDCASGDAVPWQLVSALSVDDPIPGACERPGISQGGNRYGYFEVPAGVNRDLHFIARDVPACGWKVYRLAPRESTPQAAADSAAPGSAPSGLCIENEFYRIRADKDSGRITSIVDKDSDRELLDPAARHRFGEVIVRTPHSTDESLLQDVRISRRHQGPILQTLEVQGAVHGHPRVHQWITLYPGVKRIGLAVRILKDPTPLLDAHLAFPFAMAPPRFRYEGALSVMEPIVDYLPGSYSDSISVQNWVRVSDGRHSILWSSLDAPIAEFGGLWPGYISPAHSCVLAPRTFHPPLKPEDLSKGWIYSLLFYNNFGTNFYVSQPGSVLFRYVFTSASGEVGDAQSARFGWEAVTPFEQIVTMPERERTLPPEAGLIGLEGEGVELLAVKRAEDGRGWLVRLWNVTAAPVTARVRFGLDKIGGVCLTSIVEADTAERLPHDSEGFTVVVPPRGLATVRILKA